MIQRSTLVLLTCMATLGTSAGTTLSTIKSASATEMYKSASAIETYKSASATDRHRTAALTRSHPASSQASFIIAQASGGANAGAVTGGLDINSRGEAVKALQLRLQAGGYYSGTVDGIYGLATEQAVRAFQADAELSETGSLNDETWQQLQLATSDVIGETAIGTGTDAAVAEANPQGNAPETAPTASELPAEGETTDAVISEGEGGLSRIFGLSLGLVAVLASFGIGFFIANKDKDNADDEGDWGEIEPIANQPNSAPNNAPSRDVTSASTAFPPTETPPATANATYAAPENLGNGNSPLAAPHANTPMMGQMGGTSPLTPVDIIDGLIGDLRNPDPARRRKAIWELGQRGNSVAMKPLVDAMVDADSKEKSLVLAALSEIGIRSLKPMSKALAIALQDSNPEVRKNAIRDLTRVYDLVVQISQMLGHATEDEDPEVRQTASWALEQLSRIRRTQDIDANVRSFAGNNNPTPPIDLLSSEASLRRSSQQGL
ncbi:MAG: peptidoglycan-binding protein [Phormidesmis sp.]